MDGKPEGPQQGPPTLPAAAAPAPAPAPSAKTFQCPGCAAPLRVRGLKQTKAIACGSCGAVIDLEDENFRIISTCQAKIKYQPRISLGTRGKIRGDQFEVIGYLRRRIHVGAVPYEWSEYLLFNPYKGFRWLSEYQGHWNFTQNTHRVSPLTTKVGSRDAVNYLGTNYLHFQSAEAEVTYVLGEFYWHVKVGDTCQVDDYIAPPYILSREKSGSEISWSVGDYIEPEDLWKGLGLESSPPPRRGIAPNQPSPHSPTTVRLFKLMGLYLLAAVVIYALYSAISLNRMVYTKQFQYEKKLPEKTVVTEVFDVPGRTSNLVIYSQAGIDNNWVYLNMALVNEATGKGYEFGREISYYHGVSGGESWSEGSQMDEAVLPAVPPGRYYLRIEPEADLPRVSYQVQVGRDIPRMSYLFWTMLALIVLPVIQWWRGHSVEIRRWNESDHPLYSDD